MSLIEVDRKTAARFERRHKRRTYVITPEGRASCEALLPALGAFMLSREAPSPPKDIARDIRQLDPDDLALVTLSLLLHHAAVGPSKKDKRKHSPSLKVVLALGRALHAKLDMASLDRRTYRRIMQAKNRHRAAWKHRTPGWSEKKYARAGNWLLDCALCLAFEDGSSVFELDYTDDQAGFPTVTKAAEDYVCRLREQLVYRDPVWLPSTEPVADWTEWRSGIYYGDSAHISTTFVRDHHPETEAAVTRAFLDGSMKQHVDAVNALQRVGWKIDTKMIPVVERFAGELGGVGKKIDKLLVAEDVATAKRLGDETFYVATNCDFRGRVYGISHFNFQREDHVRSLFRFAKGLPITGSGFGWLAIHLANCFDANAPEGKISKRPLGERYRWVMDNVDRIETVARDPVANVEWWRQADAPFSFVAACIEFAAARKSWKGGQSYDYITHLPICFDGSCSGIQHLAAMTRDEDAGKRVNLVASDPCEQPEDVYQEIADLVKESVGAQRNSNMHSLFWIKERITRGLVKRPAGTYAYSVSLSGMADQLADAYDGPLKDHRLTFYLAQHVLAACKKLLPKPAAAMEFMRALAEHCAGTNRALECKLPSGFPWCNRYVEPNVKILELELRGERVSRSVAVGYNAKIRKGKSMDGAAPNFVHGLDASHLVLAVTAAIDQGITNIATVHDSFGCLAPQAAKLHGIIRQQFAWLYQNCDPLAELWQAAGAPQDILPPPKGTLDPSAIERSSYAFA
jgi:DNA-directed RNA polymerase